MHKKGLYYDLLDLHSKKPKEKFIEQKIEEISLTEEELLNIVKEDELARPKKEEVKVEVIKSEPEIPKNEVTYETEGIAHDLVYDKGLKKWLHIQIKYVAKDAHVIEEIGANQAVAMKRIHDLFTNKAIKGRK